MNNKRTPNPKGDIIMLTQNELRELWEIKVEVLDLITFITEVIMFGKNITFDFKSEDLAKILFYVKQVILEGGRK